MEYALKLIISGNAIDSVPAAPEGIKVERLDDELHLTWQTPVSEKQDLTYTVYYSLTDSIDTASAKSILATNIYGNELFLTSCL